MHHFVEIAGGVVAGFAAGVYLASNLKEELQKLHAKVDAIARAVRAAV